MREDERPPNDKGLLIATNPSDGTEHHVDIHDASVDNVKNSSGGGLQAHDYWNNSTEFVRPLAAILTDATREPAASGSTGANRP
jgi:hypothetical protein